LMLVSVAAAGYVTPDLAGSASGLAGLFGYIGATLSGAGLGATAEHAGWRAVFAVLAGSSLLSTACFAFTMRAPAPEDYEYDQIQSSKT
jgi:sugar phosphate permease